MNLRFLSKGLQWFNRNLIEYPITTSSVTAGFCGSLGDGIN